jgi:hypothetical protein
MHRIPAFGLSLDTNNTRRDTLKSSLPSWIAIRWLISSKDEDPIIGNKDSHIHAYEKGRLVKAKGFLVLEDDAIMVRPEVLNTIWQTFPPDWDIILLGALTLQPHDEVCGNYFRVESFSGAHAYLVNVNSVVKVMTQVMTSDKPIDWALDGNYLRIYAATPFAFMISGATSNITAKGFEYQHVLASQLTNDKYTKLSR